MSRFHYWQYLLNTEGQPIPDANISIYLAGTNTPAYIYFDEFGSNNSNDNPQIITNNLGYFEFWIGDTSEEFGYEKGQKFKLEWEKPGVALGEIDWIDVFPHVVEVDETDFISDAKNKVISNKLAYRWEEHKNHTLQDNGFPIHGIEQVNELDSNTFPNKVISNYQAKFWNDHVLYSFKDNIDTPHGLEQANMYDDDETFNKLVSNKLVSNIPIIQNDIIDIYNKIVEMGNAGNIFLNHDTNDTWSLTHNFGTKYVSVTIYDDSDVEIIPKEVILVDQNNVTVYFENPVKGYAVITGNVVEGGPEIPPFVIEGDHGSLTGLLSDDHTIYSLVDGSRNFTGPVGGLDPVQPSDFTTKNYVDYSIENIVLKHSRISESSVGDDHNQYIHIDGRRGFRNPIIGKSPIDDFHLTTKIYVDSNIIKTHAELNDLDQDDHLQYIHKDGRRGFTHNISGVVPLEDDHLTTKNYVDTEISIATNNAMVSTIHANLLNSDVGDDHTQYVHISIPREITTTHTFNPSGSPFYIGINAYNNKVDGLNVDLLDDLHATSFIRSDINDTVNGNTNWVDNSYIGLGTLSDIKLYNDGINGFIINEKNNSLLSIKTTNNIGTIIDSIIIDPDNGVTIDKLSVSGSTELNNSVQINSILNVTGDLTLESDLFITGNIIQSGSVYNVDVEQVSTTESLIITRSDTVSAILPNELSGIKVTKYDGINDLLFGTSNDGYFKVGEQGNLQILATREDNPINTGIPFWNYTEKQFNTSISLVFDGSVLYSPKINTGHGNNELYEMNQNVKTTDSPTFNDITITNPSNIFTDINHDLLSGFIADEHINHNSVSIIAGNGLTGGGDITSSRTLNIGTPGTLSYNSLNATTTNSHTHAIATFDINGTTNQINISGIGKILNENITLSLPQDIHTLASPTFDKLNINEIRFTNLENANAINGAVAFDNSEGLLIHRTTITGNVNTGADNYVILDGSNISEGPGITITGGKGSSGSPTIFSIEANSKLNWDSAYTQINNATDLAVNNTLMKRNSSGDVWCRLFRSTYTVTNNNIAAIFTTKTIGSDFIRPSTPLQVRNSLGLEWDIKTSSFIAEQGKKYIVDTSLGSLNLTLPLNPVNGRSIKICDGADFSVNSLIILRNGNNIEGFSQNMIVDTTVNSSFELIFYNGNWILA